MARGDAGLFKSLKWENETVALLPTVSDSDKLFPAERFIT
jgi:hypothetical protein